MNMTRVARMMRDKRVPAETPTNPVDCHWPLVGEV
jgi:hypothetical protein